jgi:hypothetical protein
VHVLVAAEVTRLVISPSFFLFVAARVDVRSGIRAGSGAATGCTFS